MVNFCASKIGSLDQVWPFSAANDPIIWRPSNLTNLGRAPFYGLQPTWGGVRFLGGSPHLATAVVIREVQIGDFSHSRHSHLPHLGAQLVWVLRNFFEIRSLSETMKKDLSTAFYCPLLWGWQKTAYLYLYGSLIIHLLSWSKRSIFDLE